MPTEDTAPKMKMNANIALAEELLVPPELAYVAAEAVMAPQRAKKNWKH